MHCKLHELLFPEAAPEARGPSTALDEVLPCTSHMDDGCIANMVHGGCNPASAAAMTNNNQLKAVAAMVKETATMTATTLTTKMKVLRRHQF